MRDSNKKINIIMFNMSSYSEWESGVQNRNYHILQTLLKDERVGKIIAIDYLPHTFKRALRNYKENIVEHSGFKLVKRNFVTKISEVNDRLIIYSSVISKFSINKFYQELNKQLTKINLTDFIVWSYYPLEVGYFDKLKAKLFVFDAVDNWAEHPSYQKFKDKLTNNYQIIDEKADLIFTVAFELQNLFSHQEKVHWVPNGVDLKHYQQEYSIINRDIGDLPKPIIGYVGTIQDRFDVELFDFLVKQNSDKSFAVVGPVWYKEIQQRFDKYQNVHFLGKKSYEEIPMYIQQFDVGIIPHKANQFIKYTNPMKMYEYLACGRPVVSTSGADVEQFKDLILISNDYQEFNQFINQSLKNDNAKLVQKRQAAIKEDSWLKRVDKMLELINQRI